MAARTAEELYSEYTDVKWRERFVEIVDLMDILGDCIISNTYAIADELADAIALTAAGSEMRGKLVRKEGVPAKEALLMCALTLGHDHLFIDVDATDIGQLADAISKQILRREVRFPFVYGRDFYDAFGALFQDERDSLTHEETVRLLDTVPAGVFQYGRYIVGPWGLKRADTSRSLRSVRRVPAYHCSDPVCVSIHPTLLSTGHAAPINEQRDKLVKLLEARPEEAADWSGLAARIDQSDSAYYGALRAPLAPLLGDCLSDSELRVAVQEMLSREGRTLGDFIKDPEHPGRNELLQCSLLVHERTQIAVIDSLIHSGKIRVPRGEVRSPVTTAHLRAGAFRLRPQVGVEGVRFVSEDPGLPILRQRDLLKRLYVVRDHEEEAELDWQLRGIDGDSIEDRLFDFLRTTDPEDAVSRFVLARRSNLVAASEYLELDELADLDDATIVARVLWRLGFTVPSEDDALNRFWAQHDRLAALVQSWQVSGAGDEEAFRGAAANYFASLEGVLADSLGFAVWALTTDHTLQSRPFTYDGDNDRTAGLAYLHDQSRSFLRPGERVNYLSDTLTMYPLIRGYELAAKVLENLAVDQANHQRDASEYPDYFGKTALKDFVFRSTVPFLNLPAGSRGRILQGLRDIESGLEAGDVRSVRNDFAHYRRTGPELNRMDNALEAAGRAVRTIEKLGLALSLCWPVGSEADRWGRHRVRFSGPRGVEHQFARPSPLDWLGLPPLSEPQYLVRSAAFSESGEVLRFTRRFDSDFSMMWSGVPARRAKPVAANPDAQASSHREQPRVQAD